MYLNGNGSGYGWGDGPLNDPVLLPFAGLYQGDFDFQTLPEEVRAAVEEHRAEIHSADDMRNLVHQLMLRQ